MMAATASPWRAGRQHTGIDGVINALEAGRMTALRSWEKDRCDIYHCAKRAWKAQGQIVPLAAIILQLRRCVADGHLLAFNDVEGRTREDIAAVFSTARDALQTHKPELTAHTEGAVA